MIKEFVEAWESHKDEVEKGFFDSEPRSYARIVDAIVSLLRKHLGVYATPDPEAVALYSSGDRSIGEGLYILPERGTSDIQAFWYVIIREGGLGSDESMWTNHKKADKRSRVRGCMDLAHRIVCSIDQLHEPTPRSVSESMSIAHRTN